MEPEDVTFVEQMPPEMPRRSFVNRVARRVFGFGARGPLPVSKDTTRDTTTTGTIETDTLASIERMFKVSRDRLDAYDDVEEMESTISEVESALDILADEAVNAEYGGQKPFEIVFPREASVPAGVQDLIIDTVKAVGWHSKGYAITRDMLQYGDNFLQYVVSTDFRIVRLMHMPPRTMVRNEDEHGLLKMGKPDINNQGECAYEQYLNPRSLQEWVAGFEPWQMLHLRWNHRGSNPYGRTLLFSARVAWKKMRAMEESLVINWLTRAFARLLFLIDVTGKSESEAQAYIRKFKMNVETKKLATGVLGTEQLSVIKDIYLGTGYQRIGGTEKEGLSDVKVLDTSHTGFTNLNPVEYYRDKVVTATRVPRAYLGLERDVNAKATLYQEDKRFARTIRRVQSVIGSGIVETVTLALLLAGINPTAVEYEIRWPNPSRMDALEESRTLHNNARAIAVLMKNRVVDQEHAATNILHIDRLTWNRIFDTVGEVDYEMLSQPRAWLPEAGGDRV